jgi:hypothetical protein
MVKLRVRSRLFDRPRLCCFGLDHSFDWHVVIYWPWWADTATAIERALLERKEF